MSGATIAADIAAALREVARDTGAGELTGTISRRGEVIGDEWDQSDWTVAQYPVAIVDGAIRVRDASGTLTGETRRQLLIEAGGVVPLKGDKITVRGIDHMVDTVTTVAPGGVDLMYKVTLER